MTSSTKNTSVSKTATPLTGRCLCGKVQLTIDNPPTDLTACHCRQCQQSSGHFVVALRVLKSTLKYSGDLTWYRSSSFAQRAFCGTCGSPIFWQRDNSDHISVFSGCLDNKGALRIARHIYCQYAGGHYDISSAEQQFARNDS